MELYQIIYKMKKTYDWSVRLHVTVTNNQKHIEVVTSVHANIHQLKIEISKIMNLPLLDTLIELYYRSDRPLKSTSTLLQNEIKDQAHLTATVTRTKQTESLPLEGDKNVKTKKVGNVGLSVVSSCTNSTCVNYNQKVQINYGYGTFPILSLTSFCKCQVCPYKSQYLRPNMMCHSVTVDKCHYLLKGIYLNSCGIPEPKNTGFLKTSKAKEIQEFISKHPWHTDMFLIVKPL